PHLLLTARSLVLRGNRHDTIRIDFKRNLDLRHATRVGRDSDQLELPERAIALRDFALTLQHVNLYRRLVIDDSRKRSAFAQRNRRITFDDLREQTTARREAEAQRQ